MKLLLLVQKATTYNCITNCMCFSKYVQYVSMYVQYVQYVLYVSMYMLIHRYY